MDECQFDVIYLFEYGCWCWWSATPVLSPCPLLGEWSTDHLDVLDLKLSLRCWWAWSSWIGCVIKSPNVSSPWWYVGLPYSSVSIFSLLSVTLTSSTVWNWYLSSPSSSSLLVFVKPIFSSSSVASCCGTRRMLLPIAGLNRPPRSVGPLLTEADDLMGDVLLALFI